MANKHDVYRLHREHPTWSVRRIAKSLGCLTAYVRSTAYRNDWKIPGLTVSGARGKKGFSTDVYELGMAAHLAGLTIAQIEALSRSQEPKP